MSYGLGLVADYQREINPTTEFDKLFPKANGKSTILHKDGNLRDTVKAMADMINKYSYQTAKLASVLAEESGYNKTKDVKALCRSIWNFVYNHIQYQLDEPGQEQLRQPSRSWADRFTGVDCDCYSLFIGCILTNLNVPFRLRVTRYTGDWQHVYIVVDDHSKGEKYVIDCVLDRFNKEKPYGVNGDFSPSGKMDTHIKPTKMLNGLGLPIAMLSGSDEDIVLASAEDVDSEMGHLENEPAQYLQEVLAGVDFEDVAVLDGLSGEDDEIDLSSLSDDQRQEWLDGLEKHIRKTRNYINKYPSSVVGHGKAKDHVKMCDWALNNWHNGNRDNALAYLADEEARLSLNGFYGDADEEDLQGFGDDTVDGLDGKKKKKGKFWEKIKKGAKKAFKFIQKTNPLMIAARNGFLLASKLNFFKLATKLYPGFMSWEEAQKYNLKRDFWERKKKAADKFADTWENKLGGKKSKLVQSLKKGWAKKNKPFAPKIKKNHNLKGFSLFSGLGEPATIIGASVAAAATIIATVASLLKKNGANDLPPGEEEYPEDKVETVTNAAQDLSENAKDIADNVSGLGSVGLHDAVEASFEEFGDLGRKTKEEKAAAKAARKAKREQKKQNRKAKSATKKQTRANRKPSKPKGEGVDVADLATKAGGMVSAANELYKNKTGKKLISGCVDAFVEQSESFFTPEEQADLIKNDANMKKTMSEAGMGTVGTVLLVSAALGGGYMLFGAAKKSKPAASYSGVGGTKKRKNFKTLELK